MIWVLAIASSLISPGIWAEEDEDVAELETFVAEEADSVKLSLVKASFSHSTFLL